MAEIKFNNCTSHPKIYRNMNNNSSDLLKQF